MKKSLLALAVLGAFATAAQAQTNVTIGGVVEVELQNYKLSSPNAARGAGAGNLQNELRVDDNYNSRFWLTGTEDLGGGLSALFYVENRLNSDIRTSEGATGNGLGNGDTFVGLKGAWGQVTAGKHTLMAAQGLTTEVLTGSNTIASMPSGAFGTYSVLNQLGGFRSTVGGATVATNVTTYLDAGTRRNNSIVYRLPNLNGFSGTVAVAAAGGNGNEGQAGVVPARDYSNGREWFLQGGYANGPLYLNLAYWDAAAEGRGVAAAAFDIKQVRFSGSYKIAGFKVGLQVDRAKIEELQLGGARGVNTSRTAWEIPVSYAFGNNTIFGSFTKAGNRSGVADSGAKMWTLGYDYALSKRTNVGVYYSRLDNGANGAYAPFLAGTSFTGSAPLAGETATTYALGLKHTF